MTFADLIVLLFIFFALIVLTDDHQRTVNLHFPENLENCVFPKRSVPRSHIAIGENAATFLIAAQVSFAADKPITVPFFVSDGGQNYVDEKSGKPIKDYSVRKFFITIPKNELCGTVEIDIEDDPFREVPETLRFEIDRQKVEKLNREILDDGTEGDAMLKAGEHTSVEFSITDTDPPPKISFRVKPIESFPGKVAILEGKLSTMSQVPITLDIEFAGDARLDDDFTIGNPTLYFAPGQMRSQKTINFNNVILDLPKTLTLKVSGNEGVDMDRPFSRELRVLPPKELDVKNCDALKRHMTENIDIFGTGYMLFRDETRCMISLPEELFFVRGSAETKDREKIENALNTLVPVIKRYYPDDMIIVAGHTDSLPFAGNVVEENLYQQCRRRLLGALRNRRLLQKDLLTLCNNWELSSMRAAVVAIILLEAGIDREKLATEGHADNQASPLDPDRVTADVHRRVEIIMMDPPKATQNAIREFPEFL